MSSELTRAYQAKYKDTGVRKNITATINRLKAYRGILTKQEYLTLKGQARKGCIYAAEAGLKTIIERNEREGKRL